MRNLKCLECGQSFPQNDPRFTCDCGGLLELTQPIQELKKKPLREIFDARRNSNEALDRSGVWRFRELLFDSSQVVSRSEGNTRLYFSKKISAEISAEVFFKHEGENPSTSFKDRGMTTAISLGVSLGCDKFICASTGNTSASLASYCAEAGVRGIVIIPEGKIAFGKLSQALAFGAKVIQIQGDFDDAMRIVAELGQMFASQKIYLLNSINPFRVEGQKTIFFEILQQMDWQVPDWIVLPAGNLGNTAAFGKAIQEASELGLISKCPRIVAVQAKGANPFFQYFQSGWKKFQNVPHAETLATAIKIGAPVSVARARQAIESTDGIVFQASENEILDAKATIDAAGIGCEPASACSLVGMRQLKKLNLLKKSDRVVGILTGHLLKDPDTTMNYHLSKFSDQAIETKRANLPIQTKATIQAVLATLGN